MDGWMDQGGGRLPPSVQAMPQWLMGRDPRSITRSSAPSVAMPPFHSARVLPARVGVLALAAPGGPKVTLGYAGDSARQDFAGSSFGQC